MSAHFRSALLLIPATLWLAGCSSEPTNPNLVPVTGTVTFNGQPLAGASVTFIGVGATPGEGATGITDEAGKYELSHFRAGKGAMPGDYKVMICKRVMSDGSPIPAGTLSIAELATRETVPPRYSDYTGTQLKATVHASNPPIDFQVSAR